MTRTLVGHADVHGGAATPRRRFGRAAAALLLAAALGAAAFGATLLVMRYVLAPASSGSGAATEDEWWRVAPSLLLYVVGSTAVGLGVAVSLCRAVAQRRRWSHRRLEDETGRAPTDTDLHRLPARAALAVPRKIFPETTPKDTGLEWEVEEEEEPWEEGVAWQQSSEGAPAAQRIVAASLARLLLMLSVADLGSELFLLGWLYGWAWVPACETELGWVLPVFEGLACYEGAASESGSGSYSYSGAGAAQAVAAALPSDWAASSIDILSLTALQMLLVVASICCNATLIACVVDVSVLGWIVIKACVFVASTAAENAVGLTMAVVGDDGGNDGVGSGSVGHDLSAVVWAPHRAALLCVALLGTSAQLMLLLKMRRVDGSLKEWRRGVRRYHATQGWNPARAGWNITGDLEFSAGDVLLINHSDVLLLTSHRNEEKSARVFESLPFRYAEIEGQPSCCTQCRTTHGYCSRGYCFCTKYRTKRGAAPMRLLELILLDGEGAPDNSLELLTAEILADATEQTVAIMEQQSTWRPTLTVKTHPAARPHSAQSSRPHSAQSSRSTAGSTASEYGTDRSDSSRIAAPTQRLAVRRELSRIVKAAERDEVKRANAGLGGSLDAVHGDDGDDSEAAGSKAQRIEDLRGMTAALASDAKERPFGSGELPGLAQHSVAVSASEITASGMAGAQPFSRVMETSHTLMQRFGPGLDDPGGIGRPQSATARLSSAGVVAVSMQGLQADMQSNHPGSASNSNSHLKSVRHRPTSAGRPGSASSRPGSVGRRPLSVGESVKVMRLFDKLIAYSDPVPLPGWTQHQDDTGREYWYNAEEGAVTYGAPHSQDHFMPGRTRLRREDQMMIDNRPHSAVARFNPPRRVRSAGSSRSSGGVSRPQSAAARLQRAQFGSAQSRRGVSPTSAGTEQDIDQSNVEQMLALVESQAEHAARCEYEAMLAEDDGPQSDDCAEEGGLEAVARVEDGHAWEVPADPPLREDWGSLSGGGAGTERPKDLPGIMRDRVLAKGAVTKAIMDDRWPGEHDPLAQLDPNERVVDERDLYEYRTAPDGQGMCMVKVDTVHNGGEEEDGDQDSVLDPAVAGWLSSVQLGQHAIMLARLGTTFSDFENLTTGDLFAAGVEEPDHISSILTRLRSRVPPIRVLPRPRPRSGSPGSRGAARPGSAKTAAAPSFAESVAESAAVPSHEATPDPAITELLVQQGISRINAEHACIATENRSIEAAISWAVSSKRPPGVSVPQSGMLEISIGSVSGLEPPLKNACKVKLGLRLEVPNQQMKGDKDLSGSPGQVNEVTWSKSMSVVAGTAEIVSGPHWFELTESSQPVLHLTLIQSRLRGDRQIGAVRKVNLCRQLGPRWTPEAELRQQFRVRSDDWGEEVRVELVMVYRPASV